MSRQGLAFLAVLALGPGATRTEAQFGRVFLNAPQGTNALILTNNQTNSNTWADPALTRPGIRTETFGATLQYAWIPGLGGHTAGPGVLVPLQNMLSYDRVTDSVVADLVGMGDPGFTLDYNIFGAPAVPRDRFKTLTPTTFLSAHLLVTAPLGTYDPSQASNIGSNRWSGKLTLNYSITGDSGRSWLEFYGTARVFGTNDEYLGTNQLSQRPLVTLESHYSRTVAARTWVGGGLLYNAGGQVFVNDVASSAAQNTLLLSLAAGFPTWPGGAANFAFQQTLIRPEGAAFIRSFILQFVHFL